MKLVLLDWLIIAFYFLVIFAIAIYYTKRAGKDTKHFFLSGRNLPWWIAGTAMVATTFAADTPLAVTELVAKNGIAGNWLWWNLAIGGILTAFFFAKLWRRAGIVTDVEFVELRYSGKPAAALRGFRAIYLGLFMNSIVLAWVNEAMQKIFAVTLPGFDPFTLVVISAMIIAVYASASGLLGTARTDSLQFLIAISGSILLAVLVLKIPVVGGVKGLQAKLPEWIFQFTPVIGKTEMNPIIGGTLSMGAAAFFAHVGLQWWSSWYPGADPGGGGYIAQRMMSAKNETHSLLATIWFTVAHYTLRPWPWIIVALAALVALPRFTNKELLEKNIVENYSAAYTAYVHHVDKSKLPADVREKMKAFENKEFFEKYENTVDPGKMYPKLMVKYLPAGLLGLMIAVFLAAYMSTVASQLNWGTSYLINDFYKRFIKPAADEKHYVLISRISIILLTVFSLLITKYFLTTISGAWEFIINASAGMGAVLILRWFWWRINAWSEIVAMTVPLIVYPIAKYGYGLHSPITLYPTVLVTTIVWILFTYITKPTDEKTLEKFYRKIHPGGIGWKVFRKKYPDVKPDKGYGALFVNWFLGIVVIYSTLYGTGRLIFEDYLKGSLAFLLSIIAGTVIYLNLKKKEIQNYNAE